MTMCLSQLTSSNNFMAPKRRFWNVENVESLWIAPFVSTFHTPNRRVWNDGTMMKCGFRRSTFQGREYAIWATSHKSQSTIRISSFVPPSKIFVSGACIYIGNVCMPTMNFEKRLLDGLWSMWETTFLRNTHAGFCKDFTTVSYTKWDVGFVHLLTKSGVGISRKCCFTHGLWLRIACDVSACFHCWAVSNSQDDDMIAWRSVGPYHKMTQDDTR